MNTFDLALTTVAALMTIAIMKIGNERN